MTGAFVELGVDDDVAEVVIENEKVARAGVRADHRSGRRVDRDADVASSRYGTLVEPDRVPSHLISSAGALELHSDVGESPDAVPDTDGVAVDLVDPDGVARGSRALNDDALSHRVQRVVGDRVVRGRDANAGGREVADLEPTDL